MFGMFAGARSFNQDLGNWNVTQVTAMDFILSSTSLSWQNYDRLLIGWSNLHLQTGVTFDASQIPYTSSAESARQHIIDVYHWTIRDGGMANPPSIPLNLKVTVDNNEVNLVWEAPLFTSGFSIQNYTIYRSLISGTGYVLIGTTVTLNYTDTGMLGGRTYYYIVKANSEIGEGLSSNEVQAYPLSVPTAPIQLRALAGAGQIEIIWNASINNGGKPIDSYNIYRSTTNNTGFTLIGVSTGLTYTDAGLINGQTYYYIVRAKNNLGESVDSQIVSAMPEAVTTSTTTTTTSPAITSSTINLVKSAPMSLIGLIGGFGFLLIIKRRKVK